MSKAELIATRDEHIRDYAYGTMLVQHRWTGAFYRGRALCSDGVVRAVRLYGYADTYFSVPASCQVKGKTVSGYVTISTRSGSDVATDDDPAVVQFRAYQYGKNADQLVES